MRHFLFFLTLSLCLQCVSEEQTKSKYPSGLICAFVNDKQLIEYFHLDENTQNRTIKINDPKNLFQKSVHKCFVFKYEVTIVDSGYKEKRPFAPLEIVVEDVKLNSDGSYCVIFKYEYEGIFGDAKLIKENEGFIVKQMNISEQ